MPKIRTVTELEEAIRAGDTSITADDLTAAAAQERHEQLLTEARSRAEIAAAEQARDAAIQQLRADIADVDNDTEQQLVYATAATAALHDLVTAIEAHAAALYELGTRARNLGIREVDGQLNTDDTGIGWKTDATTRRIGRLRVDDRMLGSVDPRHVLNRLMAEFINNHRLRDTDHVPHRPLAELIADQDTTVTPPPTVQVRLLKRHGHRQPGTLAEYDQPTAQWLVAKGMATAA